MSFRGKTLRPKVCDVTMQTLSEFIRDKCVEWQADKTINPAKAIIEIHFVVSGKEPGTFRYGFDVKLSYAFWIQLLLTPFYAIFATFFLHGALEWLEDIAYFKRFTPRGVNKKRKTLEETRQRIGKLIEEAAVAYNKGEDSTNG